MSNIGTRNGADCLSAGDVSQCRKRYFECCGQVLPHSIIIDFSATDSQLRHHWECHETVAHGGSGGLGQTEPLAATASLHRGHAPLLCHQKGSLCSLSIKLLCANFAKCLVVAKNKNNGGSGVLGWARTTRFAQVPVPRRVRRHQERPGFYAKDFH